MPLYEYRCRACENVFEYMQGVSEGPKRKCEGCGGRLEKLVSRSGFVLKGTGWYETDFKGKKPSTGGEGGEPKGEKAAGEKASGNEAASGKSAGPAKKKAGGGKKAKDS